jgi:hypothetical protein
VGATGSSTSGGVSTGPFIIEYDKTGKPLWNKLFASPPTNGGFTALAARRDGGVFAGGQADNPGTDLGNGPLSEKTFAVALDDAGASLWSRGFSTSEGMVGNAIATPAGEAVDQSNHLVLAGDFEGVLNLGGDDLQSSGMGKSVFLGRLNSKGNHLWSKAFVAAFRMTCGGVAVGPDGAVHLIATFNSSLKYGLASFGGDAFDSNENLAIAVAKFAP